MKQTYEEAVLKAVMWWSDKSFRTPLNQNNGDDSSSGGMAFMLMNLVSMDNQNAISDDKIKKFEEKLTELLMAVDERSYDIYLSVDYHPEGILADACMYAEIPGFTLPCKSHTCITKDNEITAKLGYGGAWETL